MCDSLKLLKMKSEREDWCQKDERKLELRLGPPGDEFSSFAAIVKPVSHKRVAPAPVVGWPPVRSFRKNMSNGISAKAITGLPKQELTTSQIPKNGLFVKINMDGIPIGRKIDLTAYSSYENLSGAIDELFRDLLAAQRFSSILSKKKKRFSSMEQTNTKLEKVPTAEKHTSSNNQSEEYTLIYEDNEGDRMLVGDVPWHMFVAAVTRLRVMRNSELRTLSRKLRGNSPQVTTLEFLPKVMKM